MRNGYLVPVHYRTCISLCRLTLHPTQKWSVALHVLVTRRLSLSFPLPLPQSRSLAATYSTCNPSSPNSKAYFDPVSVPSVRTGAVHMHKLVPTMPHPQATQACMQRQQTYINVTSAHVHKGAARTVRP